MRSIKQISIIALTLQVFSACTEQLPGSFRFRQQEESFSSTVEVNTKIDLLWVVDNSASMDVSQRKLRQGFEAFAEAYMNPNWDIRVAVITTDTYLANSAFTTYLSTTIPGSDTGPWQSDYLRDKTIPFVNLEASPNLVTAATGEFPNGATYGDLFPLWGPNFARLLPGYHDGPTTALCFERLPYFYDANSITKCYLRDDSAETGTDKCINPDEGAGESSLEQCINTTQNDTVRSGKAILETMPSDGTTADQAWVDQLIEDFVVNVSTGSVGMGSERGLSSVSQLLTDNESTDTALFREGSLRGIIFVSDEDDQSLEIPESPAADFTPWTNFACDVSSLDTLNPTLDIGDSNSPCCTDGSCTFGTGGDSCESKTIGDYSYTISVCPNAEALIPVSNFKDEWDQFFLNLDGEEATDPNYFIVSIVALDAAAVQSLQADRTSVDDAIGVSFKSIASDRGDRYIELGELVGNGSLEMNIADDDYSPILTAIGDAITLKKGVFALNLPVSQKDEMFVRIDREDGTSYIIDPDLYELEENVIRITDIATIQNLSDTDQVYINYQPGARFLDEESEE